MTDVLAIAEKIQEHSRGLQAVRRAVQEVIVGQDELLDALLIAILADGHVLLEGLPGLAKSLAVESLARAVGADHRRIQFTPDLLPSDLLGTQVYDPKSGEWSVKKGPLFSNLVLADEINRAPAKVQSALLEAMQERQVSLAGETHRLPSPFLVLATQNPIEQEGTYPLPEAQVDRFMLKVVIGYPSPEQELEIVERMSRLSGQPQVDKAVDLQQLAEDRRLLDAIYVDEKVKRYVVDLVFATREPGRVGLDKLAPLLMYGASPRASIALTRAARARAFLEGRGHVLPQDVKAIGMAVLRHRVVPSFEAEAEETTSEDLLAEIFDHVPVP